MLIGTAALLQAYPEFCRQVFDAAPDGFQIAVAELQNKHGKASWQWGLGDMSGGVRFRRWDRSWRSPHGSAALDERVPPSVPSQQGSAGCTWQGRRVVTLTLTSRMPCRAGGAAAVCAAGTVDGEVRRRRHPWEGDSGLGAAPARLVSLGLAFAIYSCMAARLSSSC
jgi:hypothetical protein